MTNSTFPIVTPTEGLINTIDLITKNYLKIYSKNTKIISSISYMDTISTKKLLFSSFKTLFTVTMFPIGLVGHLAVFIYILISEKEDKTKSMMEMHGLKPKFYILTYYIFFLIFSFVSCCVYWLFIKLTL